MENIINYMEIWVSENLDKVLKDTKGCKCDQCRFEMMALALNNLKPHYCTSDLGKVISKLECIDSQTETNIIIEVTKAVRTVQANPNHKIIK